MLVERWLRFVVHHRWAVLAATAAALIAAGMLARGLHKDTSANAYIEPGNPALLYRERVVDTFGLKEPIVIAVRSNSPGGILTPEGLRHVRLIVERLEAVPNIDLDRITSLASRSAISGGVAGLEVAPLLPAGEIDAATVDRVRGALEGAPIYDGTLVSKDRSATIIAAELLDEKRNAETYQAVLELSRSLPAPPGVEVFVAGAGAITGYFSSYIDRDAGRLVPFTAIAVAVVLFCAFLTIRSAALPMFIAAATVVATLGIMAACGVAFYAITNGMVVVLIGISVAEPMHVFRRVLLAAAGTPARAQRVARRQGSAERLASDRADFVHDGRRLPVAVGDEHDAADPLLRAVRRIRCARGVAAHSQLAAGGDDIAAAQAQSLDERQAAAATRPDRSRCARAGRGSDAPPARRAGGVRSRLCPCAAGRRHSCASITHASRTSTRASRCTSQTVRSIARSPAPIHSTS